MVPANAVDLARIRKLLELAEDHIGTTQLDIYITEDGKYVSLMVHIKDAPESRDVMGLQPEMLLISDD